MQRTLRSSLFAIARDMINVASFDCYPRKIHDNSPCVDISPLRLRAASPSVDDLACSDELSHSPSQTFEYS